MLMKIVAINGSPRSNSNTHHALEKICGILSKSNDTEIIQVGDREIRGCMGCNACKKGADFCTFADDWFKEVTGKMYAADGIIIGSPVYYTGINGTLKSFLDRAFFQSNGRMRHKVGAALAICRRSGGMTTFEQINAYFTISEMLIATSLYWNIGHGMKPGEVTKDLEAQSIFEQLALNMDWLLKMKDITKDTLPKPEPVDRAWMNFVRDDK